jgi:hypothetical protein
MENTKILTEAQIEAIEKIAELVRKAVEWIVGMLKAVAEVVCRLWRAFIENYHNKRVIHLAIHHKDPMVRKKNRNRIVKWLRRYIKCRG